MSERNFAYFGFCFLLAVILLCLYAYNVRGEKVSFFIGLGVITGSSLHQGRTGSTIMAEVRLAEQEKSVLVNLPDSSPVFRDRKIKLNCSSYESGAVSCVFNDYLPKP